MKKLQFFFLFVLSFFFLQNANAQWSLTPSIGVNNARIDFVKFPKKVKSINFEVFSLSTKYNFTKKVAFELAFQYSNKGFASADTSKGMKILYWDYVPSIEYAIRPYLSIIGGINIGLRADEYNAYDNKSWKSAPARYSSLNSFDYGWLLGIRAKYKNIQLSLHSNRSLKSTLELAYLSRNRFQIAEGAKALHQVFQLTLGYQLNFNRL